MAHGSDRFRGLNADDSEALFFAMLPRPPPPVELAQARVEPITVPRPASDQTVTIGVVTGRPLKPEFTVEEVKEREVVRDHLAIGFDNGGKVVLKDYMHAFGMLGERRTTIIQPDGKHYAFAKLLAPTTGPREEAPPQTPPPEVCLRPSPTECLPPPLVCEPKVVICEPRPKDCGFDPRDHGERGKDHGSKDHGDHHGHLTWVSAPGCLIAGDAHWSGGRWGEQGSGPHGRMLAEHATAAGATGTMAARCLTRTRSSSRSPATRRKSRTTPITT